jgi:polyisoprenoid-binding protein YceI
MNASVCLFALSVQTLALMGSLEAASAASHWVIDPKKTHIAFEVDAVGFPRTHGEFSKFAGEVAVDFAHPERSRVEFRVDATSADAGSSSFSSYIRSDALLNATRFPIIGFVSKSVQKISERSVRITGSLTMLGVTGPLDVDVDVDASVEGAHKRLDFVARAKIDRLHFGMNSGYPIISREVDLLISSEAYES